MRKIIFISSFFIFILILSGCIGIDRPKDKIKVSDSNNITIDNYNISDRQLITNDYGENKKLIKTSEVNNYSDKYIEIKLFFRGIESGCYYNYEDIDSINISDNQVIIKTKNIKERKDNKSFHQSCAEYARHISVKRDITFSGDNFKQLDEIIIEHNNYNRTISLSDIEVLDYETKSYNVSSIDIRVKDIVSIKSINSSFLDLVIAGHPENESRADNIKINNIYTDYSYSSKPSSLIINSEVIESNSSGKKYKLAKNILINGKNLRDIKFINLEIGGTAYNRVYNYNITNNFNSSE